MDQVKDWTLRISQANQGDLLLITFEILINNIEELKSAIDSQDQQLYKQKHKHATKVLNYLIDTLDMKEDLSLDLVTLYTYVHKLLTVASIRKDKGVLDDALRVLQIIKEGFVKACEKEEGGQKVMANAQKVYAGLTYGKNDLNEVVIQDNNRGFEA